MRKECVDMRAQLFESSRLVARQLLNSRLESPYGPMTGRIGRAKVQPGRVDCVEYGILLGKTELCFGDSELGRQAREDDNMRVNEIYPRHEPVISQRIAVD